jgi:predicted component of type VI protein secretion system
MGDAERSETLQTFFDVTSATEEDALQILEVRPSECDRHKSTALVLGNADVFGTKNWKQQDCSERNL